MSASLEIELDAAVSDCGDQLTGTVAVSPGGSPGQVSVSLVATVRTAERTETTTAEVVIIELSSGSESFELNVPSAGPISFGTALADVGWSVEARWVDDGDAENASAPLTVLPSGGLAVWARQFADPPTSPTYDS